MYTINLILINFGILQKTSRRRPNYKRKKTLNLNQNDTAIATNNPINIIQVELDSETEEADKEADEEADEEADKEADEEEEEYNDIELMNSLCYGEEEEFCDEFQSEEANWMNIMSFRE